MPTELRQRDSSGDVTGWRCEQLVRTGFPPVLAAHLAAEWEVDLHRLIELVERGCPPELAARILAPLAPPTIREGAA
jgi:hypothetical protein